MARVKTGSYTKRRRKKWLKMAKGYWGAKHRLYKTARLAVMKALLSAYRERKRRKRVFRSLWIVRMNAALRAMGFKYSQFINTLKKKGIELNRKVLAEIAYAQPEEFEKLVKTVMEDSGGRKAAQS